MTGSSLPLESPDDSRSKWLGGEAHVRHFEALRAGRGRRAMTRTRFALAAMFFAGGLLGAGLTGLAWRAQRTGRTARKR
jgi:hypothetical protein